MYVCVKRECVHTSAVFAISCFTSPHLHEQRVFLGFASLHELIEAGVALGKVAHRFGHTRVPTHVHLVGFMVSFMAVGGFRGRKTEVSKIERRAISILQVERKHVQQGVCTQDSLNKNNQRKDIFDIVSREEEGGGTCKE